MYTEDVINAQKALNDFFPTTITPITIEKMKEHFKTLGLLEADIVDGNKFKFDEIKQKYHELLLNPASYSDPNIGKIKEAVEALNTSIFDGNKLTTIDDFQKHLTALGIDISTSANPINLGDINTQILGKIENYSDPNYSNILKAQNYFNGFLVPKLTTIEEVKTTLVLPGNDFPAKIEELKKTYHSMLLDHSNYSDDQGTAKNDNLKNAANYLNTYFNAEVMAPADFVKLVTDGNQLAMVIKFNTADIPGQIVNANNGALLAQGYYNYFINSSDLQNWSKKQQQLIDIKVDLVTATAFKTAFEIVTTEDISGTNLNIPNIQQKNLEALFEPENYKAPEQTKFQEAQGVLNKVLPSDNQLPLLKGSMIQTAQEIIKSANPAIEGTTLLTDVGDIIPEKFRKTFEQVTVKDFIENGFEENIKAKTDENEIKKYMEVLGYARSDFSSPVNVAQILGVDDLTKQASFNSALSKIDFPDDYKESNKPDEIIKKMQEVAYAKLADKGAYENSELKKDIKDAIDLINSKLIKEDDKIKILATPLQTILHANAITGKNSDLNNWFTNNGITIPNNPNFADIETKIKAVFLPQQQKKFNDILEDFVTFGAINAKDINKEIIRITLAKNDGDCSLAEKEFKQALTNLGFTSSDSDTLIKTKFYDARFKFSNANDLESIQKALLDKEENYKPFEINQKLQGLNHYAEKTLNGMPNVQAMLTLMNGRTLEDCLKDLELESEVKTFGLSDSEIKAHCTTYQKYLDIASIINDSSSTFPSELTAIGFNENNIASLTEPKQIAEAFIEEFKRARYEAIFTGVDKTSLKAADKFISEQFKDTVKQQEIEKLLSGGKFGGEYNKCQAFADALVEESISSGGQLEAFKKSLPLVSTSLNHADIYKSLASSYNKARLKYTSSSSFLTFADIKPFVVKPIINEILNKNPSFEGLRDLAQKEGFRNLNLNDLNELIKSAKDVPGPNIDNFASLVNALNVLDQFAQKSVKRKEAKLGSSFVLGIGSQAEIEAHRMDELLNIDSKKVEYLARHYFDKFQKKEIKLDENVQNVLVFLAREKGILPDDLSQQILERYGIVHIQNQVSSFIDKLQKTQTTSGDEKQLIHSVLNDKELMENPTAALIKIHEQPNSTQVSKIVERTLENSSVLKLYEDGLKGTKEHLIDAIHSAPTAQIPEITTIKNFAALHFLKEKMASISASSGGTVDNGLKEKLKALPITELNNPKFDLLSYVNSTLSSTSPQYTDEQLKLAFDNVYNEQTEQFKQISKNTSSSPEATQFANKIVDYIKLEKSYDAVMDRVKDTNQAYTPVKLASGFEFQGVIKNTSIPIGSGATTVIPTDVASFALDSKNSLEIRKDNASMKVSVDDTGKRLSFETHALPLNDGGGEKN